jgi:hypothetical protein
MMFRFIFVVGIDRSPRRDVFFATTCPRDINCRHPYLKRLQVLLERRSPSRPCQQFLWLAFIKLGLAAVDLSIARDMRDIVFYLSLG